MGLSTRKMGLKPNKNGPPAADPIAFGNRVKELREKQGLTQKELAGALGVSKNTVQSIEGGSLPRGENVAGLARFLGSTADFLLFGETLVTGSDGPENLAESDAGYGGGGDIDLAFDIQDILDEDLPGADPKDRRKAMKRIMALLRKTKKDPGGTGHRVAAGDESLQVVGNGIRTNGPITKK
jgi:transcriptional regulator with XRE-family HTH domain